ncbi:MAG: class I SAM-dependent methyltransferase [Clostridia bacterium]|nr:class I SAM-dependent methyltransferase [Clostridia bacterium]
MQLNNESKTLFIPLLGKAQMSRKKLFINDKKAEEIIQSVDFDFKKLKQSEALSMYMAARAAIFDDICNDFILNHPNTVVVHLGCGLDARCLRVNQNYRTWYDVDFESVISLRKRFYEESDNYKMIGASIAELCWEEINHSNANVLVIAEGVTMYLSEEELRETLEKICKAFSGAEILFDAYSMRAVKLSRYKNPVNQVNAAVKWGMDKSQDFLKLNSDLVFVQEYPIFREEKNLKGIKKFLFNHLYCGKFSQSLYKIYRFQFNKKP